MRDQILDAARRLTLAEGELPSLNSVVDAAGVSKGGLMHHFPTRASLLAGLARHAIEEVDRAMRTAALTGTAAETWLRLSLPDAEERALLQGLASAFRPTDPDMGAMLEDARAALAGWEALIAAEVGDTALARVIRLVGDGLIANAVAGVDPSPDNLEELIEYLVSDRRIAGREA